GANIADEAFRVKQISKVLRFIADRAQERETGIKIGRRNADASALGSHEALGTAKVRPAPQQLGRHTYGNFGRRDRDYAVAQLRKQVAHRDAQKHAQPVVGETQTYFQLLLESERVAQVRTHLRLIDLSARAGLEPVLGLLDQLGLDDDVVRHVLEPLLEDANLHIVRGHLGNEQHEHVVIVLDGGIQLGVSCLDSA